MSGLFLASVPKYETTGLEHVLFPHLVFTRASVFDALQPLCFVIIDANDDQIQNAAALDDKVDDFRMGCAARVAAVHFCDAVLPPQASLPGRAAWRWREKNGE